MSDVNWGLLGNGFNAMETLGAFEHGQDRRMATQQRLLSQQVGQRVAQGDYAGATKGALAAGNFDLAKHIGGLQQTERKELLAHAESIANVAYALRSVPIEDRPRLGQEALARAGITGAETHDIDWSDEGLRGYYSWARSVKDQISGELTQARISDIGVDNERADRNTDDVIGDRAARRGITMRGQDIASGDRRRGQDLSATDRERGQNLTTADRQRDQDMVDRRYRDGVQGGGRGRYGVRPGGGPPRVPGTAENPAVVGNVEQAKLLPAGTFFRGPDGVVRQRH